MKKLILFLIIVLIISAKDSFSQSGAELGKRYLKLGNSYREAENLTLAYEYLDKGFRILSGIKDYYWIGVANEYFGYYYRDLAKKSGNNDYLRTAQNYFDRAYDYFDRVISQRDGSPIVLNEIRKSLREQMINGSTKIPVEDPTVKNSGNGKKKETPDQNIIKNNDDNLGCPEIKNYIVYQSFKEANAEPENVEILDLTGQELTELPKDILKYTNLKELILTNLGLTDLPESLGNLEFLQRINLDGNDLTRLPVSLKNLKCLKTIFIRGNFIDCDYLLSLQRRLPELQIITDREEDNMTTIRGR